VLTLRNTSGQYRVGIHRTAPIEELHLVGDFYLTGSILSPSDMRFKTNITPLSNSLAKVLQLRGVSYSYRTKEFPEQSFAEGRQLGFVAQEVEKVFPELVRTYEEDGGHKAIDYFKLFPLLVESIKERQQIIETQQAKINTLKVKMQQVEVALNKLGVNLEQVTIADEQTSSLAEKTLPGAFGLQPNYPNPFNPITSISYDLPSSQHVILTVYDVQGREITTLVNQQQEAGRYTVPFDASHLSSGTYFYKLTAGSFSETKRMIFVK